MLQIVALQIDPVGEVVQTSVLAAFVERGDAVRYLDHMTQRERGDDSFKPEAGYEARQDYWWVRKDGQLTRYMIKAASVE